MKKNNPRNEYTISTVSGSKNTEPSWVAEFENQLKKQAVQPRRVDESIYEQVNSVINGKAKYKSVDAAVKEMQQRSGFLNYVSQNTKTATSEEVKKNSKPQIILKNPQIEITLKNYCSDTKGQLDVPSIIEKIKSIHKKDISDDSLWDEGSFIKFIHECNEEFKEKNNRTQENNNLGKVHFQSGTDDIDPSNHDAWHSLMPVKT